MIMTGLILIIALLLGLLLKDLIKAELEFRYYARQGISVPSGRKFLFGHIFKMGDIGKRANEKEFLMCTIGKLEYEVPNNKFEYPDAYILHAFNRNLIMICGQDLIQDLFLTKNKYYDKHPRLEEIVYPLVGNGIINSKGDLKWQQQRKSLSQSFYKQKLIKYLELMNDVTEKKIEDIKANFVQKGEQMDLIKEMSDLFIKVVLTCIFNDQDAFQESLPYTLHGQTENVSLGAFLQKCFQELFVRSKKWSIKIVPSLLSYYITKYDKEVLGNCQRIRQFVQHVAERRREKMKEPSYTQKGDLLDTLLEDELFANDNEVIVDQCLTFFFAASQTIFHSTSNVIMYGIQEKSHFEKIREEYKEKVLDQDLPFFDKIQDLTYYGQCFYEALRLETPLKISSPSTLTEDCQIGRYHIKKGALLLIGMDLVQRNPEQWQDPQRYLPDRFDPKSPLYLTPSGAKRHPYSFCPFLGGSRVCLGKTFAELATKVVGPKFIHNFNFEFVDKSHYQQKPFNHIQLKQVEKCFVKVENRL